MIKMKLKTEFQKTSEIKIIGGSAGTMNLAENVYCIPELEGEALDPNFKRNLKGVALTNINVLPHYDEFINVILDGKRYIEDIVLPDIYERIVYGINNGSYILIDDKNYLYGEAYILKNGIIEKINEDNQLTIIN